MSGVSTVMMRQRGVNVHQFCEGYGIRVRPVHQARDPRPPNTIYGGRVVARMLRRSGPDHTALVLQCAQASAPACLYGDALFAVSQFLKAHGSTLGSRHDAVAAFRSIDISQLRNRAQRLARGRGEHMARTSAALSVMIADALLGEEAA